MEQDLDKLLASSLEALNQAANLKDLDAIRVEYLGKKGLFTMQLRSLGKLSAERRPEFGQKINKAKKEFEDALNMQKENIAERAVLDKVANEKVDITLPGRGQEAGSIHPVMQAQIDLENIFMQMGYLVATGPEIEDDFHNFGALNIPDHHPARAMHDTFYVDDDMVLRTHTSPVQIRSMNKYGAPLYMVAPGRCYRCDSDLTHTPMFHQLEGLVIDKGISFAHLKGVIKLFLEEFFEKELNFRFRPSYFPFTEPSAEVDMSCPQCEQKGCRVCSHTGWLEILGCGMVHPKVLEYGNINPKEYTGFAFGLGIDRMAMLKYGIDDLRINFEGDLSYLKQF